MNNIDWSKKLNSEDGNLWSNKLHKCVVVTELAARIGDFIGGEEEPYSADEIAEVVEEDEDTVEIALNELVSLELVQFKEYACITIYWGQAELTPREQLGAWMKQQK